ncbi:DUF2059 domain-containing protein [Acuticoccus mangrovi]|uniref:DUF2059 domain-containing protein n=1 Tax=Acuticoccus mangrovi TaxID=2796142 RepID=A0A934MBG8_9HYPH|nr:DUF2059 domain-containing protein [Acuticoccus mangrovi]MBJ3774102.1 DUF2059 domain-containing protein [Acuticoccus mangrovi]
MRIRALIAAFAASLVLAAPALAQTAGGAPAAASADEDFSPSHLALAQDVIDLTRSDQAFDDILPRIADQTKTIFIRSNPALTREIEETVLDVALSFAARRVELQRTLQLIWARRFSEAELAELKAFFQTDVGAKFVEATPVITALALGAGRQWEQNLAAAMVEETRAKLREKGHAL